MPAQLIKTKLFIPPNRPDQVHRPRLMQRLDVGLTRRLTVLCAPAGFGKSTLLSQWCAARQSTAGWVSLDAGDNDPVRFLTYLVAAVQRVRPELGESARALLSTQPVHLETVATTLVNEWASLAEDLVLVLDDYHVVTEEKVHDVVTFLLENMPPAAHLLVASRTDPPLPLARLRIKEQLAEVRAEDLRFTPEETAQFFRQRAGLQLTDAELGQLDERSEGWVAGLQVAALSLQGRKNVPDLLGAFTGNHRFVFDYLAEEVFRRQPVWVQTFLLRTAVLDRMTGPLCDAVTGEEGGDATLDQLDQANLFVVPLDSERRWYRYHHLFAEFLRGYLKLKHPHWMADLHRQAARWYQQAGFMMDAVDHWLQAREYVGAAEVLEQVAKEMLQRGEVTTLFRWLETIPADVTESRGRLCLWYAWAYVVMSQPKLGSEYLDKAERAMPEGDAPGSITTHMRGEIAGLRALTALAKGDLAGGTALVRTALELSPEGDLFLRSLILQSVGLTHWYTGQIDEAISAFHEGGIISKMNNGANMTIGAYTNEARLQMFKGRLREAMNLYRQALVVAEEAKVPGLPSLGAAYVGMGTVQLEWNDLDGADANLTHGIDRCVRLGRVGALTRVLVPAYIMLSRLWLARGDMKSALAAQQQAEEALHWGDLAAGATSVPAWRAHLMLAAGDLHGAGRWAEEFTGKLPLSHISEFEYLIYSRVLSAQGRHAESVALLEKIVAAATHSGREGSALRALVPLAMALQAKGDRIGAVSRITSAIPMAESENWLRVFLDEGQPMAELLAGQPYEFARRVRELLGAAGSGADELLSEREVEVVRLLAEGLSNQDLAKRLVVTEGTAKWHVHNIYSKLDVKNRTQAVARARELGLTD